MERVYCVLVIRECFSTRSVYRTNSIHRSMYLHWMLFSSSFAMKSKQPSPSNHVGDVIINPPTILSFILRLVRKAVFFNIKCVSELSTSVHLFTFSQIVKIQAVIRGHQERSWQAFQRECATVIQAASRRYLDRKDCHNESMISVLIAAASNSLRMRNAAKRLQRWWLDEMWVRREKEAALIIERFFIFVKREVEREVMALKKKKKEKRKLRKLKQSDDWILERAWLNTMEEPSFTQDETTAPFQQDFRPPTHTSVGKVYTKDDRFIQSVEEDVQSDVSGLTDLSPGNRHFSRKFRRTQMEIEEDASLEEAFHDSEFRHAQNEEESYLRRHGYSRPQPTSKSRYHSYRSRKTAL